jgi:aryl-alcohol dehydrogenase-like predicted oxidoreductase
VSVSVLGLGGHEFHPDGKVKAFSDDFSAAVRPGYTNPNFAGPERRELVHFALAQGINYFDATIDPEVQALQTCLPAEAKSVLIQCRPQGMCYHYDEANRSLVNLELLRGEVERLVHLSGHGRIDVLNFAFEAAALAADKNYLDKIGRNIEALRQAGLVRFAACDCVHSGENHYLTMMRSGLFDVVWLNFGPLCPFPAERIFPLARELGMAVVVREAFQKANLFRTAEAGGLDADRPTLAAAAIRWILHHPEVSSLIVGVRNAAELQSNLTAASTALTASDSSLLGQLRAQPAFINALSEQERLFRRV